jgi:hypothetical protein
MMVEMALISGVMPRRRRKARELGHPLLFVSAIKSQRSAKTLFEFQVENALALF